MYLFYVKRSFSRGLDVQVRQPQPALDQARSDVDILVDVDPSIGLDFVTLADRIEQLLGLPVDLVSSRAVKPAYRREIEPELIYV